MMTADPLGHLAHGMAQNTPEPTFAGLTVEEILWREGKISSDDIRAAQAEVAPEPKPTYDIDVKPRNKGGRPRKA
jgi:hypothetical protein